jgi:hypothetical protein
LVAGGRWRVGDDVKTWEVEGFSFMLRQSKASEGEEEVSQKCLRVCVAPTRSEREPVTKSSGFDVHLCIGACVVKTSGHDTPGLVMSL